MAGYSVRARFEGPDIDDGGLSIDDLASTLTMFQRALLLMFESISDRTHAHVSVAEIAREPAIVFLTGIRRGSSFRELELSAALQAGEPLQGLSFASEALDRLLDGISGDLPLPPRVAISLEQLRSALGPGIDRITFQGGSRNHEAVITRTQPKQRTLPDAAFWESRSPYDLAREQGVGPLTLGELPVAEDDETVEEFLEAIFGDIHQQVS